MRCNLRAHGKILWVSVLFCVLLAIPALPQPAAVEFPTEKAYFPVSPEFAAAIRAKLRLPPASVEPGLYFTELSRSRYRVDVQPKSPDEKSEGVFEFDAGYLLTASYNQYLYGHQVWSRKFLHRVRKKADGTPELVPVDEFKFTVRTVNFVGEDGQRVSQTWVVRPNGERWLLYEQPARGEGRSFRVTGIPNFFLPVGDGVIDLPLSGVMHRAFQSGRTLSRLDKHALEAETIVKNVEFKVATLAIKAGGAPKQSPLVIFNPELQKMLFAGWASDSVDYPADGKTEVTPGKEVDLYLYNLEDETVKHVAFGLRWRFSLTFSGVFIEPKLGRREMEFATFDWATGELADTLPLKVKFPSRLSRYEFVGKELRVIDKENGVEKQFTIDSAGNLQPYSGTETIDFQKLSQEALHRIMLLGYPPDLLHQVGTGDKQPRCHHPAVTTALAKNLGGLGKTWVTLVYDQGEYPEDLLGSFLWELTTGHLPALPSLRGLTNAFWFTPESRENWVDIPVTALEAVDGKQSMIFLQDFPSQKFAQIGKNAVQGLQDRLRGFQRLLGDCIREKRCRVVTSVRKEMYEAMIKADPKAFADSEVVEIPTLPESIRMELTRALIPPLYKKYRLAISEPARKEAVFLADSLRAGQKDQPGVPELPGYYEQLLEDLYVFASSSFLRNPTAAGGEITEQMVEQYAAYRSGDTGRWQLRVRYHQVLDEKVPFLMWVKPGKEPLPALNEDHFKLWAEKKERVLTSPQAEHALVLREGEKNVVDLLMPEVTPARVLEQLPLRIALHKQGFFFVIEKGEECLLHSFKITRSNRQNNSEIPGTIVPLHKQFTKQELNDKVVRIRFVGDTARVLKGKQLTVYGIDGKVSEKELSESEAKAESEASDEN